MRIPPQIRDALFRVLEAGVALVIGLLVGALIMYLGGYDPWKAYTYMVITSLGDPYALTMTLSFATPLMLTALTFAVGVRAGLFNVGAEGQVYMGALGAVLVGAAAAHGLGILDSTLGLLLALLLGSLMGIAWGMIAALLKVYRGVHEVVSTIMLNWIAFWVVEYLRVYHIYNPHDPSKTVSLPPRARLPLLVEGTELSIAFVLALLVAVATYYLLWHTTMGYEMRSAGLNPEAARYAGIHVEKAMLLAFIIGGFTAGFAGACEVAGRPPHYAITTGLSNLYGLGFDGIAVSLIGANHPLGIIPASLLVGALVAGARGMQIFAGVPLEMVRIVQGAIIIFLALPGVARMAFEAYQRRKKLVEVRAPIPTAGEGGGER